MDNKKKGPAKQTSPDAEVLKAARELPQTTKSRFRLLLEPKTIEEVLTRCFYAVGSERGTEIVIDECDKRALVHIAEMLTHPESLIGFVFSGSYDSGKTTFMLVFQKFLCLLKNIQKHGSIRKSTRWIVNSSEPRNFGTPWLPTRHSRKRQKRRCSSLTTLVTRRNAQMSDLPKLWSRHLSGSGLTIGF